MGDSLLNKRVSKIVTTLFTSRLPLALFIALLLGGGFITYKSLSDLTGTDDQASVLGERDDEDEDEDGEEDSDDDDEDEDEDGEEDSDDDDEDGDDDDDDRKIKTREKVINDDGTISEIKREVEGREMEVEIKTYDTFGNLISERTYERSEDGEEEIEIKTYDAFGNVLRELSLETEDGELELEVNEGEREVSRIEYDVEDQKLEIQTGFGALLRGRDEENKVEIRVIGKGFSVSRSGVGVLSNFPLTVEDDTGQIFVGTPIGTVELKAMPDTILQQAELSGNLDEVGDIELSSAEGGLEYKVLGTKAEKLLGVFNLQIPSVLIFDAETGGFLRTEQPFLVRVLDLFSL